MQNGYSSSEIRVKRIKDASLKPRHKAVVFIHTVHLVMRAAGERAEPLDVLLLGGLPVRAPIAFYGPFVMNTREEIQQALDDYLVGRVGVNPKILLSCRY